MNRSSKICIVCGKEFTKKSVTSWGLWNARKFCSRKCMGKAHGKNQTGELNHRFGKKNSQKQKEIVGLANKGENSHLWKGEEVDYRSLHAWIVRWRGTPDTCEGCGISGLTGHQIHWANIDGKYRRVLDDFIRLCAKCHWHYDRE